MIISVNRLFNEWFLQLVPIDHNIFIKFFDDIVIRLKSSLDIDVGWDRNIAGLQDLDMIVRNFKLANN